MRRSLRRATMALLALAAAARAEAPTADDDAAVRARAAALWEELAAARGEAASRPPRVEVIDDAALARRRADAAAVDAPAARARRRWGLPAAPAGAGAASPAPGALYDPARRRLYVSRGLAASPADPAAEAALLHELAHARHDPAARRAVAAPDDDAALARRALREGAALAAVLEVLLARQGAAPPWGLPDTLPRLQAALRQPAAGPAPTAEVAFIAAGGLGLVAALRARAPWSAVDDALAAPPRSTEQVLHPARYAEPDEPQPVPAGALAAPSGWRTVHATVRGEAGWVELLEHHGVAPARAARAADGWGGDRVVLLGPDDGAAAPGALTDDGAAAPGASTDDGAGAAFAAALTTWDSELDAVEFEEAMADAVDALVAGVAVERVDGRTAWLDLELGAARVERRGDRVLVVLGAPLPVDEALAAQAWRRWASPAP